MAGGLEGNEEQFAMNSSPMRYTVLGEVITGESLGGTASQSRKKNRQSTS